jgi:hypothetical protein
VNKAGNMFKVLTEDKQYLLRFSVMKCYQSNSLLCMCREEKLVEIIKVKMNTQFSKYVPLQTDCALPK